MVRIPSQSLQISRLSSTHKLNNLPLRVRLCSQQRSISPTGTLVQRRLPSFTSLFTTTMAPADATVANGGSNNNNKTATNSNVMNTIRIRALPRALYPTPITSSPSDFQRADPSPDSAFYVSPRFVQHIDDAAVAALKAYYGELIREGDSVVDLCSSWTSHLPDGLRGRLRGCVGYGLNAEEMQGNGWLTGFWVRDLNAVDGEGPDARRGGLLREVGGGTVDVVICNASVDYLTRPLVVLEEVRRVLKVGGTAHMAFSNRCFPTKAIGRWLRMSDKERRMWVGSYFWAVGGFEDVEEVILKDGDGWGVTDPMYVVRARKGLE